MKLITLILLTFVSLLSFISNVSIADEESLGILKCEVSGPQRYIDNPRTMTLTIIPPKNDDHGFLMYLDKDHNPEQVIIFGSAIGEIQVEYGNYTERRDLIFTNVGHKNGSSHKGFWVRAGVMQHPSFFMIDVWDENIPIHVMDTSQPQPMMTGNCSE